MHCGKEQESSAKAYSSSGTVHTVQTGRLENALPIHTFLYPSDIQYSILLYSSFDSDGQKWQYCILKHSSSRCESYNWSDSWIDSLVCSHQLGYCANTFACSLMQILLRIFLGLSCLITSGVGAVETMLEWVRSEWLSVLFQTTLSISIVSTGHSVVIVILGGYCTVDCSQVTWNLRLDIWYANVSSLDMFQIFTMWLWTKWLGLTSLAHAWAHGSLSK